MNRRIYSALSGLRRAGVSTQGTLDGPSHRTWGTLCVKYESPQDARLHAALRPLLHYTTAATPATLAETMTQALARIGILPAEHNQEGDVFQVVGAVKGDGARQVQFFYNPNRTTVDEYLLLS